MESNRSGAEQSVWWKPGRQTCEPQRLRTRFGLVALSERGPAGEGAEEGTGKAARDDESSAVLQADPATD